MVGRPRSERADTAITEAVLAMLAQGTALEALSIEAVAARAGVGKATIYRRWSGKEELIADVVAGLKRQPPTLPGGSVREDLVTLLCSIGTVTDGRAERILSCLIPQLQLDPELNRRYQELVEPRRELTRSVLRRGMASGELRADLNVDVAVAVLCAPLVLQLLLRWQPGLEEQDLPAAIVDLVLGGAAAPGQAGTETPTPPRVVAP